MPILLRQMLLVGGGVVAFPGVFLLLSRLLSLQNEKIAKIRKGYHPWLIMAPLVVVCFCLGQGALLVLFIGVSLLSIKEFLRATGVYEDLFLTLFCYGGAIFSYVSAAFYPNLFGSMPVWISLPILISPLIRNRVEGELQKVSLSLVAVLIIGWFPAHMMRISEPALLLFLLIGVELGDASAFIGGKIFGKRPLLSDVSPNKTIGGAISALFVLSLYTLFSSLYTGLSLPLYTPLLLWLAGMGGDLFVSFLKREIGIKDMGFLIPGHGGMLDRFDSLLFAAPLFFYLICGGVL